MTVAYGFGPRGPRAASVRPDEPADAYGLQTWFKDASAKGARDGTVLPAHWLNMLIGERLQLAATSGVSLPGGSRADAFLAECIVAIANSRVQALVNATSIVEMLDAQFHNTDWRASPPSASELINMIDQHLGSIEWRTINEESLSALMAELRGGVSTARDTLQELSDAIENSTVGVVNNLTSDETGLALSAAQGKALKTLVDAKLAIADLVNDLTTGGTSKALTAAQGVALKTLIDANSTALAAKLAIADVINDLTTGGSAKALSAAQGVALKAMIDAVSAAAGNPQALIQQQVPNRNLLARNGGMEVWQLVTTANVAAGSVGYTPDSWYTSVPASHAATVSRQAGLVDGSQYCARVQRNSGQTGTATARFCMPLDEDEVIRLRGQTLMLSFVARAGANWSPTSGTLNYAVYTGTAAVAKRNGGTFTGEVTVLTGSVNLTAGGSAQQFVSAISAAVGSNVTAAEVQFTWAPTGTAGAADWFEIDDVQLEAVPSGITGFTPVFERRPYQEILSLCYRHFEYLTSAVYGSVFQTGGYYSVAYWPFRRAKRVSPTVTLSGGTAGNFANAGVDGMAVYQNTAGNYAVVGGGSYADARI